MQYNSNKCINSVRLYRLILMIAFSGSAFFASSQNLNNPNKKGPLGIQVNTLSGNVYIPRTDMYIPARGFGLDISFHYNSFLYTEDYGYGNGWTFQYNIKYSLDTSAAGAILILWGDGREDKYDSLPGGSYKSPKGFFNTLTMYQPGKYVVTEPNGMKCFFDNAVHKRITRMEEANGNFINFNYTDSTLTSIANGAGQVISFTYTPEKRLSSVTDANGSPTRVFTYTYELGGNLKEVTNPLGGKYKYTYLVNGPMKTMSDRNNNKVNIIYYPDFTARELIGCNKRLSFSYDSSSQISVVTDHLETGNQVTNYTYKKVGNNSWLTSVSGNCCGFNMKYEYDSLGNRTKITDANGQVYTYTYDDFGNVLTATDPMNNVSSYSYTNDFKKINSFTDPKGNLYTLSYDATGNLLKIITPGNNIYTATYNTAGDIISGTDPKGNAYVYNYDVYGNPTTVNGPEGYNATLVFDARGNLLSFTDARGNQSSAEYDILNRLKKITDPINNFSQVTYDAEGNIVSLINKNNETNIFNYDASNRLVKAIDPVGNESDFSYDGMDNLLAVKNPLGHEINFNYNKLNRLKSKKDPEGNATQYEYDDNGNITRASMPNGRTLNYTYDQLNRLLTVTDTEGSIASYVYDKNGNISNYNNSSGATTTVTYDSLNRIKSVTDPLGNTTSYTYDKNNNIIGVTDREGRTSIYTYDNLDRVKTYTDNNGFIITVGYDAQSNVISLTDQNNNTTTYTYDQLNRRKRMVFPDGKYNELNYDSKGNITSKRLTDASIITYQYDALNRVISRTLPSGELYSFTYDKLGRVLTATNNAGTATFTYDALNRVSSENFEGRITRYNYNITGRTQTTIYPDSTRIIKEFDSRNRITRILKDSILIAKYDYNNSNQLTQKTFGNGANSIMQYDFANRLSNLTTSTASGTIQNSQYSYDKEYNRTAIIRPDNQSYSEQFTYDNNYRLIQYKRGPVGNPVLQNSYTYDAVGNRTGANLNGIAKTYTVNNLNQLTGVNSTSFTFDDRGNISFDGTFFKTYDAENRLVKDSASPGNIISYAYDAIGRRVMKSINGNALKYTYSGAAQIEERDASGNLLNKTVFTGFLSPLMNEKNGNKYYYHPNEMGSVEAITGSNGRLIEKYKYDVYGKLFRYDSLDNPLASSLAGNRFGFTGQEYDSATGSYRFFFRNYAPETGVFNQRDLIEYKDGMGMYQYVGNNPANGIDIWGLEIINYTLPESEYDDGLEYINVEKDPCSHNSKGVRIISKRLIDREKQMVLSTYGAGNYEYSSIFGDFIAGVSADSKFYTDHNGGSKYFGGNEYYFDGRKLANYDLNYYFTATANASRGWSSGSIEFLTAAWQPINGTAKTLMKRDLSQIPQKLNELPTKLGMTEKGVADFHSYTGNNIKTINLPAEFDHKYSSFGEWWPVLDPATGEVTYEFFSQRKIEKSSWEAYQKWIKENCDEDQGTEVKLQLKFDEEKKMWVFTPFDPNLITGPQGKPDKAWVSVKDRLPYTIQFENDSNATARARYVKITSPIEPKQDPATLELASVGFNNQVFDIPPGTASYYQRLDARDSAGVFVDLTAGYDFFNNQVFWEFQAIDPVTLLPPEDPMAGFLFLKDSIQSEYGKGFVNFSIKPRADAQTLDTIGARAFIVFDENDVIPTNIHTNTIDAVAPTSQVTQLSSNSNNPIHLSWTGNDDPNGSGIDYYTVYISTDLVNYSILFHRVYGNDTTFTLPPDANYCFFVLATDITGNAETLRTGATTCTSIGNPVPVSWLYFNGTNREKNNLLKWATVNEQNSKEFRLERSLNGTSFTQIATIPAAGNSSSTREYQYTDMNIHLLNSPVMFYRLKQADNDDNFKYSAIVRLTYFDNSINPSIVYPNPTNGQINILIGDIKQLGTEATLTDVNGRILKKFTITSANQAIDLSNFVNGLYFVRLKNKEVLKIIKQ